MIERSQVTHNHSQLILDLKVVDVASIKKLPRMGHTLTYFPFGAMI